MRSAISFICPYLGSWWFHHVYTIRRLSGQTRHAARSIIRVCVCAIYCTTPQTPWPRVHRRASMKIRTAKKRRSCLRPNPLNSRPPATGSEYFNKTPVTVSLYKLMRRIPESRDILRQTEKAPASPTWRCVISREALSFAVCSLRIRRQ